jgi:type I restriction enzyme, R subunit
LNKDAQTSLEVFGGYIHTYKFSEGVEDGVVLDLIDMRHLIDSYIEADEPRKISPFDNMSLVELIVKTGIAKAIATQLGGMKGNKNAIAETIENNVRSRIIKEHLNDPAFYEKMSAQLQEIIEWRKARAIDYEQYLKRIAELVKKVAAGKAGDTPKELDTPGKQALYNNLLSGRHRVAEPAPPYGDAEKDEVLSLAIRIDETVKRVRPDSWRDHQAKENAIKRALLGILHDVAEVERIFLIIKAQSEY